MSSSPDTAKLAYVLSVLNTTSLPHPDYHAVAAQTGLPNANQAYVLYKYPYPFPSAPHTSTKLTGLLSSQKKFKSVVESAGFKLIKGQMALASSEDTAPQHSSSNAPATAPRAKNPAKAQAKKLGTRLGVQTAPKTAPKSKKRRVEDVTTVSSRSSSSDDQEEDGVSNRRLKEENEDELDMVSARGVRERSGTVKAEDATEDATKEETNTDEEAD